LKLRTFITALKVILSSLKSIISSGATAASTTANTVLTEKIIPQIKKISIHERSEPRPGKGNQAGPVDYQNPYGDQAKLQRLDPGSRFAHAA
jgi:hypothetical protein